MWHESTQASKSFLCTSEGRNKKHINNGAYGGKELGNLCRVLGVPEELEVVFREASQPVMVGPDRQRRVWLITAAQQQYDLSRVSDDAPTVHRLPCPHLGNPRQLLDAGSGDGWRSQELTLHAFLLQRRHQGEKLVSKGQELRRQGDEQFGSAIQEQALHSRQNLSVPAHNPDVLFFLLTLVLLYPYQFLKRVLLLLPPLRLVSGLQLPDGGVRRLRGVDDGPALLLIDPALPVERLEGLVDLRVRNPCVATHIVRGHRASPQQRDVGFDFGARQPQLLEG